MTYLTRHQWPIGTAPDAPAGVRVIEVSGPRKLYSTSGRRTVGEPLQFGWGVFRHLVRHGRSYDVAHLCGFPYFPLIAARLAKPLGGPPMVADWFEIWSARYWRDYLGPVGGRLGAAVQTTAVACTKRAFVYSELGARNLRAAGLSTAPTRLAGMYAGPADRALSEPTAPNVVFVGRHIADKGVAVIPETIRRARETLPALTATVLGDGPERPALRQEIARLGLSGVVESPGFVSEQAVERAIAGATCLLLPSTREGYGLVVIEAASYGTPVVVVYAPDNAATELVEPGRNGEVATSPRPEDLAPALLRIHAAGAELRRSTHGWFHANSRRLSIETSIDTIESTYSEVAGRRGETDS